MMFKVLIDILKKAKNQEIKMPQKGSQEKLICLVVNCLLRIEAVMASVKDTLDQEAILLELHSYVQMFEGKPPREDFGIKMVKTILNRLCRISKEKIWVSYEMSVQRSEKPDIYIKNWITVLLKPVD